MLGCIMTGDETWVQTFFDKRILTWTWFNRILLENFHEETFKIGWKLFIIQIQNQKVVLNFTNARGHVSGERKCAKNVPW